MTKQELVKRVALRFPAELSRKMAAQLVDAVFAELADYFVNAKEGRSAVRLTYPGFGTFTRKRKRARAGRNPQTGEPIEIPATTTVSFQPGQELRAALNRSPLGRRRAGSGA
jgi:nucleoid DNA-binding protein